MNTDGNLDALNTTPTARRNTMAIQWIKPTRSGRTVNVDKKGIHVALAKRVENRQIQIVFGIQSDVMKSMRWVIGDRVILGHDAESGIFVLARHPEGYKLTPRNSRKRNDVVSKCVSATLKMTAPDLINKANLPMQVNLKDCEVDGLELRFFLW